MRSPDILHIASVILRYVHRVVRHVVVSAADAKVHHKGGAGHPFLIKVLIIPAPPEMVRNQTRHGARKISVDNHSVGPVFSTRRAHTDSLTALKENLLHRLIQMDLSPQLFRNPRQACGDRSASSDGMVDPVLIFEKRQDGEQSRTLERRHTQVFRLKRECQAHALIAEILAQFGVE